MGQSDWLAEQFEENRGHMRGVAYRILGSVTEADDAVQETWLRLSRSDTGGIGNLSGWLTTVVARVCLDMLRSRKSRREESMDEHEARMRNVRADGINPEQEALLADSVGLALLVVLDRLDPAERLAFVLHDMFAVPFEEIARIVGRTPTAARQLASRARRRVQGAGTMGSAEVAQQREVVDAFLSAMRAGDFERLIAVLDPDVLVRVDAAAGSPGAAREIRGAANWARGALAFSHAVHDARPVLVDGSVGLVYAPGGHLSRALRFTFAGGKIAEVDVIGDPARLRELELAVLNN